MNAQIPTTSTRTSAVGPGQARATTPASSVLTFTTVPIADPNGVRG